MKDTDFYSTIRLQAKLGKSSRPNTWIDWGISVLIKPISLLYGWMNKETLIGG